MIRIQLQNQNQALAVAPCHCCAEYRFGVASSACRHSHFSRCRGHADYRSLVLCRRRSSQEVREKMKLKTNKRPGADAAWRLLFPFSRTEPRAAQASR